MTLAKASESEDGETLTLLAPAKVNLTLQVTGRRTDGYHLLNSLTTFAVLGDELAIALANGLHLTVDGEFADDAGQGESNLVLRAAHLLRDKTGCRQGARIALTKHLPVGAGLGGGSADAAATLHGLNKLWQLDLSDDTLAAWAPELGADVAMCLLSQPVLARGIGDELTSLPFQLPALYAVLAHTRMPLLSVDVYRALDALGKPAREEIPLFTDSLSFPAFVCWLQTVPNDIGKRGLVRLPRLM